MIKRAYKKIFKDKAVLDEMLDSKRAGANYPTLALRYNCDHTTIIYHCNKAGLTDAKKYVRQNQKPRKPQVWRAQKKKGHCFNCEMKLTSSYHLEFPCKPNEKYL